MHSGQNTMAKNYIWGKMQWRKRRGFGKIHTKKMQSGQNTMAKNYIWGKDAMEKSVRKVSAKYIGKQNRLSGQNTMAKN